MQHNVTTQGQVQRFYDVEAASYDASRYESPRGRRRDRFHKALLLRLLRSASDESLIDPPQSPVLEIGCGTGRLLEFVATSGYQVTGVDLSEKMLEQARVRLDAAGLHDVHLLHSSDLPFPPGTFSAAYSVFVVNLIPDFQQFFCKVAKVLEPGGAFIFNVPNRSSVYWPFGTVINWRRRTSTANAAGARYSHWFTRRECFDALGNAGFTVDSVWGEPPWCGQLDDCRAVPGESAAALLCKSLFIRARLNKS